MYEGVLCNEICLEIFKDGINTGRTIDKQKIRDEV